MNLPPEVSEPIARDIMNKLKKYAVIKQALETLPEEIQLELEQDICCIVTYLGA